MSLIRARTDLNEALQSGVDAFSEHNVGRTMGLANDWFGAYKEWEARDTFLDAIRAGRMTFRQAPDHDVKTPMSMKEKHGADTRTNLYQNYKYDVGVDSLPARMNPASFTQGGHVDPRGKYQLGLHDLSASIMSAEKPTISEQVRWKPPKPDSLVADTAKFNTWSVVFMPLAEERDLEVFALLNSRAKDVRNTRSDAYARVVEMRRRITRIKLGDDQDIGAAFLNIKPRGSLTQKFRYGLSKVLKPSGDYDQELEDRMRMRARQYTGIVRSQRGDSNEIVMCYREHAGDRFPLVVKWDGGRQGWSCQGPSARHIGGGIIFDEWARTQEIV